MTNKTKMSIHVEGFNTPPFRAGLLIFVLIFILACYNTKTRGLETVILKESEDGNAVVEQIGDSVYVRLYNLRSWGGGGETRRYMNITSLMSADEFICISNRIAAIGTKEIVQKPALDFWRYGSIKTSHELSPYWTYPRYDIEIGEAPGGNYGYIFMYYPKGYNVDITNYSLDLWNFGVPNYQEGCVYVMITYYNDFKDSMTDKELFEISRMQIETLKKLITQ